MAIQLGCGSWADADYADLLYPRGIQPELRLSGYACWFDRVEVNSTYYSTPRVEQVKEWIARTPAEFTFDIRLHRAISQSPAKAAQDDSRLSYFLSSMQPLLEAKRLGAFLLVLSPGFKPDRHTLAELDGLIAKLRPHALAIELRHSDWVAKERRAETLDFFRQRKVTWVAVDMPRIEPLMPPVDEVTQPDLAYLRLHGRNLRYFEVKTAAERHAYAYSSEELDELAGRIRALAAKAATVRVVANNHHLDFAARTALTLKERLGLF